MKKRIELKSELRPELGRKVKRLRKEGWVPATVYGRGFESKSIKIKLDELAKVYQEAGESSLVDLVVGEERWPILFKNPVYNPLTDFLVHIDCYKVDLTRKITATVPIELIGESSAVKEGNVLIEINSEVEVEALPTDLPDKFEIDISKLTKVGDVITVAELDYDKEKVELKVADDQLIAKIEEPAPEEIIEETTEEVAPGDVPTTEQKTPEELEAEEKEKAKDEKTEAPKK